MAYASDADISSTHTGSDNTSRLSAEMLAEIFSFLQVRHLILASHVSRSWRSSALAFPALWSCIQISWPTKSPDAILDLAISRAGELPVDFEYAPNDFGPRPQRLFESVDKHMHRFRSFTWACGPEGLNLTHPAALLRAFVCTKYFSRLPADFLGGSVGSLRTLRLGAATFPRTCPALATVTHLSASCAGVSEDIGIQRIFALCPRLETLHLRNVHARPEGALPAGPAPRSLKVVKLQAPVECDIVQLFGASSLTAVPHVELEQPESGSHDLAPFLDGALDLVVTFEPPHTARIAATMPGRRLHTFVLCELHKVTWSFVVFAKTLYDVPRRATVRELRLPLGVFVLVCAATFPWPAVARLTVDIAESDDLETDTQPFAFGDGHRRFRWAPPDCQRALAQCFPVLETLVLSFHSNDGKTVNSAIDGAELAQYLAETEAITPEEVPH